MGTIEYTIISGSAPFIVELPPFGEATQIAVGTYQFVDVPDGEYILTITDSNDCVFEKVLTVNPTAPSTTTTTLPMDDSIIVGNTEEILLIFNENNTNRSTHFTTNDGDIATIYLWFRTTNGAPLITDKVINYDISSTGSTFIFNSINDENYGEVNEVRAGPSEFIRGQILLKSGFIEMYFKYTFTQVDDVVDFVINLSGNINWLNTTIPIIDETNIYGVNYIDEDNVIMKF